MRLVDQFDRLDKTPELVEVIEPVAFCNPTLKVHQGSDGIVREFPVQHPEQHLTCYTIVPPRTHAKPHVIRNQFGTATLDTFVSDWLCVPSLKQIVPTLGGSVIAVTPDYPDGPTAPRAGWPVELWPYPWTDATAPLQSMVTDNDGMYRFMVQPNTPLIECELVQLTLTGVTIQALEVSPRPGQPGTAACPNGSTGFTHSLAPGGWAVDSFFDVFTELPPLP